MYLTKNFSYWDLVTSFFKEDVNHLIRFHYAKKDETLKAALDRLADLQKIRK